MTLDALNSGPHLSLVSAEPDPELELIAGIITHAVRVTGRLDLEELFGRLLETTRTDPPQPKTLDLLGHSTPEGLLVLGNWIIDAASPTVTAFFRGLADAEVLPRLGVHALRLLGCKTAEGERARTTLSTLADILALEVYGTEHLLYDAHYDANGFRDTWQFLLTSASALQRERNTSPPARNLDIDTLPAVPLGPKPGGWSRLIASPRTARAILRLVRREAGARMAGLLLEPCCEIALPANQPGTYHIAQVLLGGELVRFQPDGDGLVYPIEDPQALCRVIDSLSAH